MTSLVASTGTILDRIVAQTAVDVEDRRRRVPVEKLRNMAETRRDPIDVRASLLRDDVAVIPEFKRASPSKGRFPVEMEPADVAGAYVGGGAAMISCLTDGPFFQGSLDDLLAVASVADGANPHVGVLRKDFMIDPYQVVEARAYGASCILLIVACLPDDRLSELQTAAWEEGLSVLVEVHDEREMDRALDVGATLVGINNRNLHTFDVSLDITRRLAPLAPPEVVLIGESGIFTHDHVVEMGQAGVDAVLVGESLIVQEDRAAAVQALAGAPKYARA